MKTRNYLVDTDQYIGGPSPWYLSKTTAVVASCCVTAQSSTTVVTTVRARGTFVDV